MKNLRRMLLPFLFTTVTLFFIAETSLAQDVLKVAGGKESHKVLIDNNSVRVFDVRLQPRQKIAMHSHPVSVVYFHRCQNENNVPRR